MNHRLEIDVLLRRYCEDHSTSESAALLDVERSTHLKTVKRLDASDTLQGRLISFISKLIQPRVVLEIGTFTAYATGCLAEGLTPDGKIISIEHNPLIEPQIVNNLKALEIEDRVQLMIGDAVEILQTLDERYDLIFFDAAKTEYSDYYDLTIDKLRSGGVILADNILWKGRVLDAKKDKKTHALHEFNQKIVNDDRVEVVLLPYRDGISFIRKK